VQLLNSDATTNNLDLSNDQDRATAFAKQYVLNYPINQPNDVYSSLTEQNKLELRQEFEVAWNKWSEVQTFQIT
jgi:hypothetical protein